MPNFSKGKIYKLVSNKSSDVYIGSCLVDLSKRLYGHKSKSNKAVSKSMFVDGAIISIVLIEDCPCENKNQLKARELHFITTLECINKNKPFITDIDIVNRKEWMKLYDDLHKEEKAQRGAEYYKTHKEQIAQYRETNKEQIKATHQAYNETHKEQIAQQKAEYYETHKEEIKQRQAQYDAAHKEQKTQAQAQYRESHKEQRAQYDKQYYQLQKLKQSS